MANQRELTKRTEGAAEAEQTRDRPCFRPNVDIYETDTELVVLADMPGARADGIDVRYEHGALTIHGRVDDRPAAGTGPLLQEYGVGDFWRTFQVSEDITVSGIEAEFKDGVLTLRLPKAEAARPRQITVKAS
jgi:HSP20 family protein